MKKLFVLLALYAVAAVGCDVNKVASECMNRLVYMKDYRSGICFAEVDTNYATLTAVPCTPAVEALLINKCEKPRKNQCSKNTSPLQPEKMEQK